jgi:hypothetical protein
VSGRLACLALAAAAFGGCGNHPKPLADSCTRDGARIERALAHAPGPVTLAGTPLSDCVEAATGAADLQSVGATFTDAGAALAGRAPRDRTAALRLGYLVGAVERGAKRTAGFQDELTFRMKTFVEDDAIRGPQRAAVDAGLRAGRRNG